MITFRRGVEVPSLDREKKWSFVPKRAVGDKVEAGDIIGVVQETPVVECRIMVPYKHGGTIKEIKEGEFTVEEEVCVVTNEKGVDVTVPMMQKWPVRKERPYKAKQSPDSFLLPVRGLSTRFSL